MTTYYITNNDKIELWDTDKQRLIDTLLFKPELVECEIIETEDLIIDGEIITQEEYDRRQAEKERERINQLTMTSLDLINIIKSLGVDDLTIMNFLQNNPVLNMQLTYCQNCYCGVIRQLCPITIGDKELTDEYVVYAFRKKNGEDVEPTVEESVDENSAVEEDNSTEQA